MAGRIFVFADILPLDAQSLHDSLQAGNQGSLLNNFFQNTREALRQESHKLYLEIQQARIPPFEDFAIFTQHDQPSTALHPALQPLSIILARFASVIRHFENHTPSLWPSHGKDIIVGVAFGEVIAAAISLSRDLASFVTLAVDVVRMALRLGLLANRMANELELNAIDNLSWSIRLNEADCTKMLDKISRSIDKQHQQNIYTVSKGHDSIIFGGTPSSLARVFCDGRTSLHSSLLADAASEWTGIQAPYHAHNLYSSISIEDQILERATLSYLEQPEDFKSHIGGTAPTTARDPSSTDYLTQAFRNILCKTIDWEEVANQCVDTISSCLTKQWHISLFSSTRELGTLCTAIQRVAGCEIKISSLSDLIQSGSRVASREPLAIVGMSGRFPGAADVDQLWELLFSGKDCHKEIPRERFDPDTHLTAPAYGCFIDKPGLFDRRFFNMSPREACQTDPGQRLALVTAYEALEMSGFVPNRTPSSQLERVGVFFGQVADEYKEQNAAQSVGTYFIPGTMRAFGPGRISYYFKFGGPSLVVDTACSSSLMALHVACNSVWNKDCDTAVVGGMNIITSSDNYNGLIAGHFLSPTGSCKTLDDNADGYCRGEAVASIVMKPLSAALRDNDRVLGTVLSCVANHSWGATSITRPWAVAQEKLFRKVISEAGLSTNDIGCVELHGTGTQAGDAEELTSIFNTFLHGHKRLSNPLILSAVKPNLGHGESASGITSLVKSLLMLRERSIPPHVGIKGPVNRVFANVEKQKIIIPGQPQPFSDMSEHRRPARFLINNFDAAGGNVACVISEAPESDPKPNLQCPRALYPITVSAKSEDALKSNATRLREYLIRRPDVRIADLSYTTTARRSHYPYRMVALGKSTDDVVDILEQEQIKGKYRLAQGAGPVAFVFAGQGTFSLGSVQSLSRSCQQFRSNLARYESIAQSHGFPGFMQVVYSQEEHFWDTLPFTAKQLLMVSTQMALYRLMVSFGINPILVSGHSFGEYAALFAACVLSANDTLYLVGKRASLFEELCTSGTHGMLAVNTHLSKVQNILDDLPSLEVACINTPDDIVLAGPMSAINEASTTLKSSGFTCTALDVEFAYHSAQTDPVVERLESGLECITFHAPKIPVACHGQAGKVVSSAGIFSSRYICQQLRGPVNFVHGLEGCHEEGLISDKTTWLEISTHPICLRMIQASTVPSGILVPTLRRKFCPWSTISQALSALYLQGSAINWSAVYSDIEDSCSLVDIPTYAWDDQEFWIPYRNDWLLHKDGRGRDVIPKERPSASSESFLSTTVHRLLKHEIATNQQYSLVFESDFADPRLRSIVEGHSVAGENLCPASVYIDIALTIANHVRSEGRLSGATSGMTVRGLDIMSPIIVPRIPLSRQLVTMIADIDLMSNTVSVVFQPAATEEPSARCHVTFSDQDSWLLKQAACGYLLNERLSAVKNGKGSKLDRELAYTLFASLVKYDIRFQGMDTIHLAPDLEASATIRLSPVTVDERFFCPPYWIDSFMHLSGLVLNANPLFQSQGVVFISHGIQSVRLPTSIRTDCDYQVHVKMQEISKNIFSGFVYILHEGAIVGVSKGVKFQRIPKTLLKALLSPLAPAINEMSQDPEKTAARSHARCTVASTLSQNKATPGRGVRILDIIAEECGVDVDSLIPSSTFESLGIDSLMSLSIIEKAGRILNIELPTNIFTSYTSIGEFQLVFSDDSTESSVRQDLSNSDEFSSATSLSEDEPLLNRKPDEKVHAFRTIVAELIGVNLRELVQSVNLSDLGVDSMMHLTIMAELKAKLNLDPPNGGRHAAETLASLEQAYFAKHAPQQVKKPHKPVDGASIPLLAATVPSEPNSSLAANSSVILQNNPRKSKQVLFLFPDGSGSAASYLELGNVPPDICIVGLNSPFLRQGTNVEFTVESLVSFWLPEIRRHQEHGPYFFGGWSAGGYYAMEAARAMFAANDRVDGLILIDCAPRSTHDAMSPALLDALTKLRVFEPSNAASYGRSKSTRNSTTSKWILDHFKASTRAIAQYNPEPLAATLSYDMHVTLVWATDGVLQHNVDELVPVPARQLLESSEIARFLLKDRPTPNTGGWEHHLPGARLSLANVPGTHFSMMQKPNSLHLSEVIASAIVPRIR